MRVISGKARRIILETLPGDETRPTTDRIKETLFNMISDYIYDANFLDLFAGSGQMGIEALSRGAKFATFVDNNPKARNIIDKNLQKTKLDNSSSVYCMDVLKFLSQYKSEDTVDVVFIDPPYHLGFEYQVLEALSKSDYVDENTLIIVEATIENKLTNLDKLGFEIEKIKAYKTNQHYFIKRV